MKKSIERIRLIDSFYFTSFPFHQSMIQIRSKQVQWSKIVLWRCMTCKKKLTYDQRANFSFESDVRVLMTSHNLPFPDLNSRVNHLLVQINVLRPDNTITFSFHEIFLNILYDPRKNKNRLNASKKWMNVEEKFR